MCASVQLSGRATARPQQWQSGRAGRPRTSHLRQKGYRCSPDGPGGPGLAPGGGNPDGPDGPGLAPIARNAFHVTNALVRHTTDSGSPRRFPDFEKPRLMIMEAPLSSKRKSQGLKLQISPVRRKRLNPSKRRRAKFSAPCSRKVAATPSSMKRAMGGARSGSSFDLQARRRAQDLFMRPWKSGIKC